MDQRLQMGLYSRLYFGWRNEKRAVQKFGQPCRLNQLFSNYSISFKALARDTAWVLLFASSFA